MFKYLLFLILPFYCFGQLQDEKENYYLEDQLYLGLWHTSYFPGQNAIFLVVYAETSRHYVGVLSKIRAF